MTKSTTPAQYAPLTHVRQVYDQTVPMHTTTLPSGRRVSGNGKLSYEPRLRHCLAASTGRGVISRRRCSPLLRKMATSSRRSK